MYNREAKVQLKYAAMIMLALAIASAQSHADLAHGAGPVQEPSRPGGGRRVAEQGESNTPPSCIPKNHLKKNTSTSCLVHPKQPKHLGAPKTQPQNLCKKGEADTAEICSHLFFLPRLASCQLQSVTRLCPGLMSFVFASL